MLHQGARHEALLPLRALLRELRQLDLLKYINICVCNVYVHMYMYMHMYTYHTYKHVYSTWHWVRRPCSLASSAVMGARSASYIYIYIYTYIHIRVHIYIYIHISAPSPEGSGEPLPPSPAPGAWAAAEWLIISYSRLKNMFCLWIRCCYKILCVQQEKRNICYKLEDGAAPKLATDRHGHGYRCGHRDGYGNRETETETERDTDTDVSVSIVSTYVYPYASVW